MTKQSRDTYRARRNRAIVRALPNILGGLALMAASVGLLALTFANK